MKIRKFCQNRLESPNWSVSLFFDANFKFLVAIPVALLAKKLVAVLTLERLGASVGAQVVHDIALFVEEFETDITLEYLIVFTSLLTFHKGPCVELRCIIQFGSCLLFDGLLSGEYRLSFDVALSFGFKRGVGVVFNRCSIVHIFV